jgi:ATP-dependent DNA ligase
MRCDAFVDPAQLQQAHMRRAHQHRAHVPQVRRLFDVLHHDDRDRRSLKG